MIIGRWRESGCHRLKWKNDNWAVEGRLTSPPEMKKQEIGGATGSASSHRNLVSQKHTTLKTSKQKQANNINKQHKNR